MKNICFVAFSLLAALVFLACSKDNQIPPTPPVAPPTPPAIPMLKKVYIERFGQSYPQTRLDTAFYLYDNQWRPIESQDVNWPGHVSYSYRGDSVILKSLRAGSQFDVFILDPVTKLRLNFYEGGWVISQDRLCYTPDGYCLGPCNDQRMVLDNNDNLLIAQEQGSSYPYTMTYDQYPNTIGHLNRGEFWKGKQSKNLYKTKYKDVYIPTDTVYYVELDALNRIKKTKVKSASRLSNPANIKIDTIISTYEYY